MRSESSRLARLAVLAPLALGACLGACAAPTGTSAVDEATGQVSLAITTVPAAVVCIQVTATGSSAVTKQFAVTAGSSTVALSLGELPLGTDTITGQAYNVACASVASATPTWIADPQTVTLQAGLVTNLSLTFREDNAVSATANFVGNVTSIGLGETAGYFVMSDGTVRGTGTTNLAASTTTATTMPGLSGVVQVASGSNFSCALLSSGTIECWGSNANETLGNGNTSPIVQTTPVTVTGISSAIQITAGAAHVCALLRAGTVYCWGYNGYGELGNGTATSSPLPVLVLDDNFGGGTLGNVTQIAAGGYSTCAVTGNGLVSCWGYNGYGQLGNGTTTNQYLGNIVALPVGDITPFTAIAAGLEHFCALTASGVVWCWGANYSGQLGNDSITSTSSPGATFANVTQIAASGNTTCALTSGLSGSGPADIYCWGDDSSGGLGLGNGGDQFSPEAIPVLASAKTLAGAGGSGAGQFCAVMSNMQIECWGYNINGNLGTGSTADAFTPVAITLQ